MTSSGCQARWFRSFVVNRNMEETRRSALNELRVVRRVIWMVNVQKEARASTLLVSSSTGTIHSALGGTRWRRARSPRIAAPTAQQNQADSQDTMRFAIACMRANNAQDMRQFATKLDKWRLQAE
jgi:hypothetical protein